MLQYVTICIYHMTSRIFVFSFSLYKKLYPPVCSLCKPSNSRGIAIRAIYVTEGMMVTNRTIILRLPDPGSTIGPTPLNFDDWRDKLNLN